MKIKFSSKSIGVYSIKDQLLNLQDGQIKCVLRDVIMKFRIAIAYFFDVELILYLAIQRKKNCIILRT